MSYNLLSTKGRLCFIFICNVCKSKGRTEHGDPWVLATVGVCGVFMKMVLLGGTRKNAHTDPKYR